MKPGDTGLTRWLSAVKYSWQGIRDAYKLEAAFREEITVAIIAIPLAFYLGESAIETILLAGSVILLMVVELLNSAIEAVVDRVGDEYHALSGRAKDMGAGAVFFTLMLVVMVWALILYPRLVALF